MSAYYATVLANAPWTSSDMPLRNMTSQITTAALDHLRSVNFGMAVKGLAALAVGVVALANVRSWPFYWHCKIFKPFYILRFSYWSTMARVYFASPARKKKAEDDWWEGYAVDTGCIGAHPLEFRTYFKDWVSFDDSDFNGHMSNSSYPKILDSVRFKAVLEMFPVFFRAGGWIPLAGTQFRFLKEIPMLKSYEIWTTIFAWDDKWLYMVHKFTSRAEPKEGEETINGQPVHTIAITRVCFKVGRITVPPSLVLAVNGFTAKPTLLPGQEVKKEGESNEVNWTEGGKGMQRAEPEQWERVKDLMHSQRGGNPKALKKLLCGGWRGEKEKAGSDGVWWEKVFEDLEERRLKNLDLVRPVDGNLLA